MTRTFVGREHELGELNRLYAQGGFQFVVLYGRRRVGKTMLASEFSKDKPHISFTAKVQTNALNLRDFTRTLCHHFGLPQSTTLPSWDDALDLLAREVGDQRLVVVFDEFPYAAMKNRSLVSTLQIAIDHVLGSTNVFLVLTGSNQGFMEQHVLGSSPTKTADGFLGEKNPLFGRRTSQIHLSPFDCFDAAKMLPNTDPLRLAEYYACFGGTPYYLSMIDERESLTTNVERLFFTKEGLLYEEPLMLLRQELREPALYSSILETVATGATKPQQIADRVGDTRTSVGSYLETLRSMGLIERIVPFRENARTSRRGLWRVCDPCLSFWYQFVQPSVDMIELDAGELAAREAMRPERLSSYVGHWFERICLTWVVRQAKSGTLPLAPTSFGSWWGTNPALRQRDDVDVVAANARTRQLLLGECKWRNEVNETETLGKLAGRAAIFPGYVDVWLALFTKLSASQATVGRETGKRVLLVSCERMYESVTTGGRAV